MDGPGIYTCHRWDFCHNAAEDAMYRFFSYLSWLEVVLLVVALMSGILSLFREVFLINYPEKAKDGLLFWRCVFIAFIISAIWLWVNEHGQTLALREQLDQLTSAQLKLVVDELGVGTLALHGGEPSTGVFVIANITNAGAPSIAEGWTLKVVLTNGDTSEAPTAYLDPNFPLTAQNPAAGPSWKISQSDALYAKTMSKPIERGMKIRGILVFKFDRYSVEDMKKAETRYVLGCTDVNGKAVTAEFAFKGTPEPHHYYPGLGPIPQ